MCAGCGACVAACPAGAVETREDDTSGTLQAHVDPQTCIGCALCRKVCPPLTWPNTANQGESLSPRWSTELGHYDRVVAAYSNDPDIRRRSASGGAITTLLVHLLETKAVTGAIVTRRRADCALRSEAFVALTKEEIVSAQGSKYSPVSFDGVLRHIMGLEASEYRLAVVGLPCHLEGLNRLMQLRPRLKDLVRYRLAILCGQTPSFWAYHYILRRLHIDIRELTSLTNRGDGWPGTMTIRTRAAGEVRIPYRNPLAMGMVLSSPFFIPLACQLCPDPAGFTADASFCDAWLDRFSRDTQGVNLVLVKNARLAELLQALARENKLTVLDSSLDEFHRANAGVIGHKAYNQPFGLPVVLGAKSRTYGMPRPPAKQLTFGKKVRLFLYFRMVKSLAKIDKSKALRFVNAPVLFLLKASNFLKR
jgi:coenzyme F420 hydrogenase subunit beta